MEERSGCDESRYVAGRQPGSCTRRAFIRAGALALPGLTLGPAGVLAATVKRALPSVDLTFISSKLTLVRREEWTDTKPRPWLLREAGSFDRLTIHHAGLAVNKHTVKNAVINDLENILAGHLEKDYADIGYHLVIDFAGRVWEGRSLAYEGAHVAGHNEENIAVMLLGNFEKQEASKEQVSTMVELIPVLRKQYNIKPHRVYGHRDLGPSVCPGKNVYPHLTKLKARNTNGGAK